MDLNGRTCKIIAKHSGMAIAVAGAGTGDGAKVIQWPWNGGDEQVFLFTDLGNNHYRITPKHSGSAIGKGADFIFQINDIIQWSWADTDDQKFKITPVSDGYFKLETYGRPGKALAVGGASQIQGAGVIVWDWLNSDEQKFQIIPVDNPLHIPWSFNLHPEDVGLSDTEGVVPNPEIYRAKIEAAFKLIKELGGRFVRTDFSWKRLADGSCKDDVVKFYDHFTETAQAYGIGINCILFRCPARLEKDGNWDAFVDEFSQYCRFVAEKWGNKISTYQIWNEANHILAAKNPIKYYTRNDAADLFVKADKALQAGGGNHVSMINIMCNNDWSWENTLQTWIKQIDERCHDHRIRTIGIDHYPGTWTLGDYGDWWPMERVVSILEGKNYNWAIAETGFASGIWKNVDLWHTPEEQKRWMEVSLGALYKKLRYNQKFSDGLQYINLYQLYDADPNEKTVIESWSPFESYFGVCDFKGNRKPAFFALEKKIAEVL